MAKQTGSRSTEGLRGAIPMLRSIIRDKVDDPATMEKINCLIEASVTLALADAGVED